MAEQVLEIGVDLIRRGRFQPRTVFGTRRLEEMARSIRSGGLVQPIVVRPLEGGYYELVAGERRWRATQMIGLQTISAVVRDISDEMALSVSLIENIHRDELRPIEEARALKRLLDDFSYTHEQVAQKLGWQRTQVTHSLRLLGLIEEVQRLVDGVDDDDSPPLERGHAKVLAGLTPAQQRECARLVVDQGWSVRDLENYCRNRYGKKKGQGRGAAPEDPDVRRLVDNLSDHLGAPVAMKYGSGEEHGDLVIHYHSHEELQGILEKILPQGGR